jgi:hypothetical protein
LGAERIGDNGYVGWVRLHGISVGQPGFELTVETTAHWCALDDRFTLSADPDWVPEAVGKLGTR